MTDDDKILEIIQNAINDNRIEEARSLLRPLMERNVVEAFLLASRVAYTQEQALEFLRYALALNPDNTHVKTALQQLEALYATQASLAITDPNMRPVPDITRDHIEKLVTLFRQYGWRVILHDDDNAQFMRRQTMSAFNAFVLGLGLHIFGLILTIILLLTAERLHAFAEAEDDMLYLTSSKGNLLLHRPQQAIIFLDKHDTVSLVRGVRLALIGMLVATILWMLLYWQLDTAFIKTVNPLAATPT